MSSFLGGQITRVLLEISLPRRSVQCVGRLKQIRMGNMSVNRGRFEPRFGFYESHFTNHDSRICSIIKLLILGALLVVEKSKLIICYHYFLH